MMNVASKKVSTVYPERAILTSAGLLRVMAGICNLICVRIIQWLGSCCFMRREDARTGLTRTVIKHLVKGAEKCLRMEVSVLNRNGMIYRGTA